MALQFDHIGIVVYEISVGRDHLRSVFGVELWTEQIMDGVNQVVVQFGRDKNGICYELVAPLGQDSPVLRALKQRNPILNHIAYLTDDLENSAAHLRANRYVPAGAPRPAIAYRGKRIQFFVSPLGFIVELIEAPGHRHSYHSPRDLTDWSRDKAGSGT